MLRRRNVNIKTVKELDAFPKVPEPYVDKTAVGGTCKFFLLHNMVLRLQLHFMDYFYFQFPYLLSAQLHI